MTDEDVRFVQGARVHSVHFDEMGKMSVLREVRARRIANHELYKVTTATPEYRHEWEEMLEDFSGCLLRPVRGRVRVQWSVDDNRALTLDDIARRKQDYLKGDGSKSDLYDARVAGEHVDMADANPFPRAPLLKMLDGCQRGRLESLVLRGEPKQPWEPDYRDILPAKAQVERWLPYNPDHSYLLTGDPSRGVDDPTHDPCELQVWDWTEVMLVCRFGMRAKSGGFLDEDSLAILADILGRQYGNALVDGEVANGRGEQFFLSLRKLRYPNLARDDKSTSPGVVREQYGWTASQTANGEIVNAIIKGLNDDSFLCFSQDVVQQLLDVREDNEGRPSKVRKGARHHREAMICAGRALHWIQSKPAPNVIRARAETGLEATLRKEFGRPVEIPNRRAMLRSRDEIFRGDA